MVYRMTETNLWPRGPEIWQCSTNKGSAAALPLCNSAGCPTGVRWTSAVGQMVLAFMTCTVKLASKKLWEETLIVAQF
jgi:hypothetical protein